MMSIAWIGFLAGALTTLSVVPQVVKSWRGKTTQGMSLYFISIIAAGTALWLVYGLIIGDMALIVANTITFLLDILVLLRKTLNVIKHGEKP